MKYSIQRLNLFEDWVEIIKNEMVTEGYTVTETDLDKISMQYFNLQKKLIQNVPRKILKSDIFNCPNELRDGLELLERKIENGEDLKPHLSRLVQKLDKRDELLYDWDIYHLHLGTTIETDGYIKRTGPVLFARFDETKAYFINVLNHGAWTEQQMLKVIHENWPESIASFRIKGVTGVEYKASNSDIGHFRKANINTVIEVGPGVVYMGPGGGIAASGHSFDVVRNHQNNKTGLEDLESDIFKNIDSLVDTPDTDSSFIKNPNFDFKLMKSGESYFLYEKNNDFSLRIFNK